MASGVRHSKGPIGAFRPLCRPLLIQVNGRAACGGREILMHPTATAIRAPPIMQGSPPADGAAEARLGPAAMEPLGVPAHPRNPADRRGLARQRPSPSSRARRGRSRRAGGRATATGTPTTLAGLLDETYTDGFLVLKDGKVAYERYFNGMDERTLHLSQSMAKSVTGIGVRHTGRARPDRSGQAGDRPICRSSPPPAGPAPACSMCST